MPFAAANLSLVTEAAGFNLWHYECEELAPALVPGFFAHLKLVPGDILVISAPDGRAAKGIAGGHGTAIHLSPL